MEPEALFILLGCATIVGIVHGVRTLNKRSKERADLSGAALHLLYPRIPQVFRGNTPEQADHCQKKIDHYRRWASTLDNKEIRRAYIGWLNYYQRELNRVRHEMRTGKERRAHEEWCRREDQHRARIEEVAKTIPFPPEEGTCLRR